MEATQEAILPAAERTQTVPVISRLVKTDDKGVSKEFETTVQVFVRPLPFRRWPTVMGHVSNLFQYMPGDGLDLENTLQLAMFATQVLGVAADDVFAVLELATDRNPEFFDTLDPDDGLKVVLAVIEVNKGFFVQKVLPLISEHLPAAKESIAETLGRTE